MSGNGLLPLGAFVAGRFQITGLLGDGGMGAVYSAMQVSLDREVALKVVHPRLAVDPASRKRFLREAKIAAALRHRNAAEIYDFGDDGVHLYLAMELLDGAPLRAVVDDDLPPHPFRDACRIARQVADVLVAARELGVVHRDLKPENIMLTQPHDGLRVVVVDFGLAYRADHTVDTGRITAEGMASGTPNYMAPEQIRGLETTPATDVYALGCVLYELLTAHSPFVGRAPALTLSRHLFVTPEPLRVTYPALAIPAELDELVLRMIDKAPELRPSAVVVRDTLARLERTDSALHLVRGAGSAGRPRRMLSERPTIATAVDELKRALPDAVLELVCPNGDLDEHVRLALGANGITLVQVPTSRTRAAIVVGGDVELVRVLQATGIPVIAEVDVAAPDSVATMLRAGAADVVPSPIDGTILARRIARAIRKATR